MEGCEFNSHWRQFYLLRKPLETPRCQFCTEMSDLCYLRKPRTCDVISDWVSSSGLKFCDNTVPISWIAIWIIIFVVELIGNKVNTPCGNIRHFYNGHLLLCNAVACPHLVRSGMSTACSRSASAHLYHADGRLTSCDGAATDCI